MNPWAAAAILALGGLLAAPVAAVAFFQWAAARRAEGDRIARTSWDWPEDEHPSPGGWAGRERP